MRVERVDCFKPEGQVYGYQFKCPGCGHVHLLPVKPGHGEPIARWDFNGDVDFPTFTPSILASGNADWLPDADGEWTGEWKKDAQGNPVPFTCHSFVTAGRIQFLGDCTHALANQTVDLPEVKVKL